ncbi:MAG: YkvA family protein [Actinomycetota bacterium]
MGRVLIGVIGALLLSWLALIAYVWIRRPHVGSAKEGLRLLPDIVRLIRGLAADRSVGRGVRFRLWLLLAYLAFPIDLVPDVIPVIGYLDDLVILSAVLRSVVQHAGAETVRVHWSGTETGLEAVWRLARLPVED